MLSKYGGSVRTMSTLDDWIGSCVWLLAWRIRDGGSWPVLRCAVEDRNPPPSSASFGALASEIARSTCLTAFGNVPRPTPSSHGLISTGRETWRYARRENRGTCRRQPNA